MTYRRAIGVGGEVAAADYLCHRGYRILVRNYRSPLGEIDIVAEEGDTLVFIEVKTRSSALFGVPQEAVTIKKQKKIGRIALYYLSEQKIRQKACRFDVVSVLNEANFGPNVDLVKNAFDFP